MEKHLGHIEPTAKLARQIHTYKNVWVSENSSMLTGGLIGVESLHFKTAKTNEFMLDILNVIPEDITTDIKNTEVIKSNWKIVSDPVNLSWFYLMYLFENSSVSNTIKERAVKDLLRLFFYRSLAALHSNGFSYLQNTSVARAVFETLSNRFLIKKHGSWLKVTEHFVETSLKTKHGKTIKSFKGSEEVKNLISYCSRRMASTFKEIYNVMANNLESGVTISSTSSEITIGDDAYVKDIITNPSLNIDRIMRSLSDKDSFMDKNVFDVAMSYSPSINNKDFEALLLAFQKNNLSKTVRVVVTTTSLLGHDYLTRKDLYQESFTDILQSVKGLFISSRNSDKDLLDLRKTLDKFISRHSKNQTAQTRVALRLGLLIYIFILFLTK